MTESLRRHAGLAILFIGIDGLLQWWLAQAGLPRSHWHLAAFAFAFGVVASADARVRKRPGLIVVLGLAMAGLRGGWVAIVASSDAPVGVVEHLSISLLTAVGLAGALAILRPFDARDGKPAARFAVVYALALRLLYAPSVELLPDETYYWQYAQHLAWSYLDHPPLVGWSIALTTSLFGDATWAVRLPALLAWCAMAAYLAAFTGAVFDAAARRMALVLASTLPLCFGMGFFLTPDILSYAAWAALLYYAERALIREDPRAWYGFGIALGLGLLSKYSVLFPAMATLVFALSDRGARRMLVRPEFGVAVVLALLLVSPVLLWNAERDWVSFTFQSTRRLAVTPRFSLHYLALHVLLVLTPLGAWMLLRSLGRSGSGRADRDARRFRLMMTFIALPLVSYLLFSLRQYPRFHWTGGIWLAAIPLLADRFIAEVHHARNRALVRLAAASVASLLLLYAFAFHALALGLPGMPRTAAADYTFWREATPVVIELREALEARYGRAPVVVGMAKWSIASTLEFHDRQQRLGPVSARHLFGCTASMYERWRSPEEAIDRPVLLIGHVPAHLQTPYIDDRLEGASPVRAVEIRREGRVIRRLLYREAARYLGPGGREGLRPPAFDCGTDVEGKLN